ncbi:MAG: NADH-quinone oxidoreductase subunit N [Verrucomicrobiota bacterium]
MNLSSVFWTPEFFLTLVGSVLLLWDAISNPNPKLVGKVTLFSLVALLVYVIQLDASTSSSLWSGLYLWDAEAKYFKAFFLIVAILVVCSTQLLHLKIEAGKAEFYIITLFATAGMLLLASVQDLILLFVALELVTVSFYVLVAYHRSQTTSLEAGVKYLIMGAVSSTFLIMGSAYLFGISGSTHFDAINLALRSQELKPEMIFGLALVLVGLLFKVSVVPFHIWAPDVYQGAPLPVTSFLAVGSKAAGFVLLLRLLSGPFAGEEVASYWISALSALSGASMILGNFAAIPQRNLKRMLAYSGIGHAGFILAGLISNSRQGQAAVFVYLTAYLVSAMTVFIAMSALGKNQDSDHLSNYSGLSQRSPWIAAAMALGLISLAGIPPLIGFMGKFTIFMALWQSEHYALFGVGIVSAVAGLYYYLGIVRAMYWSNPSDSSPIVICRRTKFLLVLLSLIIVVIGFWSQPLFNVVKSVLGS